MKYSTRNTLSGLLASVMILVTGSTTVLAVPTTFTTIGSSNTINQNESTLINTTIDNITTTTIEVTKEETAFISTAQLMRSEMIDEDLVKQAEADRITAYAITDSEFTSTITKYTDLNNRMDITVNQMNFIIDHFLNGRDSELKNMGQAYIDASKKTGYDPVFLLALTACEAGWTVSNLHSSKNNPYSINMVDLNPSLGYTMGNTFYDGIVNGAIWIHENYYNNGGTSLYNMIYGNIRYASSDRWIGNISYIMQESYNLILN